MCIRRPEYTPALVSWSFSGFREFWVFVGFVGNLVADILLTECFDIGKTGMIIEPDEYLEFLEY